MANEKRLWANFGGGLVENNPLAAAATSLTSAGLAALPAVGATEHVVIVFDPDGTTGVPFAKRVTAHTAAATTATIEAAAIIGTAREIAQDTPWVHSVVAEDMTAAARAPKIIAEQTLGAAATFIEFSAIPATFKHLKIEGRLRGDGAGTNFYVAAQVGNGAVDTGATSYGGVAWQNSVSATDYNSTGRSDLTFARCPGATATADVWGLITLEIQDYLTTTYWRAMEGEGNVHDSVTSGILYRAIGEWKNKTSPIDVVRIKIASGNLIAGSQLRLVGIPAP